jgi:hypothetical protein
MPDLAKNPLKLGAAKRIANRLKREVMLRGPFRLVTQRMYQAELAAHAKKLPILADADMALVAELQKYGVLQRQLTSLGVPGTDAMIRAFEVLVPELKALPVRGNNAPRLPISRLLDFPAVYLWGLDPRLLDMVERYLGLPVHYHGADLRREIADGQATDVRQWHVDAEDHRMFKIIAYLNDVTEVGGPFEYITRENTVKASRELHYVSGFVTDERMETAVPKSDWKMATGPKYAGNIADTCAVFHRAKPPVKIDRYSITFSWLPHKPMKSYPSMPMSQAKYDELTAKLTPRQRTSVPPRTPE